MNEIEINYLQELFQKENLNNKDREILANSLYYYCCGKDPSPIIAFGAEYPLYIYVDIVDYGCGNFEQETQELYERLKNNGFKLLEVEKLINSKRLYSSNNNTLTMWNTPQEEKFFLLYVQGDAIKVFRSIYSDNMNFIQPKCICNYRNEIFRSIEPDFLKTIEKRTEYIFGYCYNEKYKCIAKYKYYGDYEKNTEISLFHRTFWYVY